MVTTGDEFNAAVAAELRGARGASQFTLEELADRSTLSRQTVMRYLNGKREIPLPALYAMCGALGIDPVTLFRRAQERLDSVSVPVGTVTDISSRFRANEELTVEELEGERRQAATRDPEMETPESD